MHQLTFDKKIHLNTNIKYIGYMGCLDMDKTKNNISNIKNYIEENMKSYLDKDSSICGLNYKIAISISFKNSEINIGKLLGCFCDVVENLNIVETNDYIIFFNNQKHHKNIIPLFMKDNVFIKFDNTKISKVILEFDGYSLCNDIKMNYIKNDNIKTSS
jgi:hypothetical protein